MEKRKPFSILKWLVFPSLSLALAATVAWFNIRAFGWEDGAIYCVVVAAITLFSIAINKYVRMSDDGDSASNDLAVTAFIFEIVLTLALAINAAYSLSVQREMSVARQSKAAQSEDLKTVKGIRDRRAQREAAGMLRDQSKGERSVAAIFAENERPLFWIMIGELLAYGVAAFTLLATASLRRSPRKVALDTGLLPQNRPESDFPEELDVDYRPSSKNAPKLHLSQSSRPVATPVAVGRNWRESAIETLRQHLGVIAFSHPGRWFAADLRDGGGVWIRMRERQEGREVCIAKTKQSDKLLMAVNRPDFRERLERELIHQGFPIGGGK